ncbi:hypothetical protein [Tenacibaculum ovolyticum]|uniref:hypothetical protein n=1 Tax=Tenacibaculum ovolyticum TaxID=104270 RepID=UPI0007ECD1FA|nr:hypothetical protein [Tenacibaculum ovolyticum]
MDTSYINKFKAKSPAAIIDLIFKEKEEVAITLTLKNGIYLEGFIVDVLKEEYQIAVCLRTQNNEVFFFNVQEVCLLGIKYPKQIAVALSDGSVSRPINSNETISGLELKRWVNKQQEILNVPINLSIDKVALQELNVRLNCKDIVNSLLQAVTLVCNDSMALDIWKTITSIIIVQAANFKVKKVDNVLAISIDTKKALPEKLENILVEKIESVL